MGNNVSHTSPWSATFQEIKSSHDAAYVKIEEAISLEEAEDPRNAIERYKDGIQHIDKALNVQVTCPETPDRTWTDACEMIKKLKRTRAEVLMRINCIQSSNEFLPQDPPPSYDETMSSESDNNQLPQTYSDLANALENLQIEPTTGDDVEIIYSQDNVRLYFISPSGEVLSTSESQMLYIASVSNSDGESQFFLQVGDWVYPLLAGLSPCVRTEYGAFVLPDVHSTVPGSSVGIILPAASLAPLTDLLENLLHGVPTPHSTPLLDQHHHDRVRRAAADAASQEDTATASGLGQSVSSALVTGAGYISRGLVFGAEKVTGLVSYGTPRLIGRIRPVARGESVGVPVGVRRGVRIVSGVTGKAAEATGFLADKVGIATGRLGQYLAPHLQRQGTRLLHHGFNVSEGTAASSVGGVLLVATGAVEGFATVYHGLETSAGILSRSLKENSVKVVQHKYGNPVAELTGETFDTMANVITISHNANVLRPRGLAKSIAKSAVYNATVDDVTKTSVGPSTSAAPVTANASVATTSSSSSSTDHPPLVAIDTLNLYPTLEIQPGNNENGISLSENSSMIKKI